jgi:AraC family transcriptional regulator
MHAWESIQKTVDYIEDNIGDEIAIERLADIAALSPFYYQSLFSRLVKKPVREYIKLRRLARACNKLRDNGNRILDVAVDFGFGGHETFTRAFKAAYRLTPSQYRENPVLLNHFEKPELLLSYTITDECIPLISEGIVLEINRRIVTEPIVFTGISDYVPIQGQIPVGEVTGVDIPGEIWRRFLPIAQSIRKLGGRNIGVAYSGDAPKGSFTYFVGTEAENNTNADGLQIWTLPACEYIICGFEAENFEELVAAALDKAWRYIGGWLKKHGLQQEAFAPEIYYENTASSAYMEVWVPLVQE